MVFELRRIGFASPAQSFSPNHPPLTCHLANAAGSLIFPATMSRRAGFTLLEICLAVAIALLLLGLAIPSVSSLFADKKLKDSFNEFDSFVRQAQMRSVNEQRAFVMIWQPGGIVLQPDEPNFEDRDKDWPHLESDGKIEMERPVALQEKPPMEWMFWRSGTCEPVVVHYEGPAGKWTASYDALTVRGTLTEQETR